ncbi:RpiR family transcriptional regulator [Mycoplasma testudineum]|uniref:RpiR family transcriptional regulator n=1 Tax=Mycoplasma testudineum TaxID=244584 RepID=A0A4V3C338_9MOLU|nr:hypothetical protein [Mycoplasma testudineum]OYD26962.1 hypothetical protein CG473_01330 [Mycoplasma testudineum]TDO20509.1 RpiR family transcriptional regulator [Mycoplasma testudineum]
MLRTKIKEHLSAFADNLSFQENKILNYIFDNPLAFIKRTSEKLCKELFVGKNTITSLSHKLKFKSVSQLKKFIKSITESNESNDNLFIEWMSKIFFNYHNAFMNFQNEFNKQNLHKMHEFLKETSVTMIYSTGRMVFLSVYGTDLLNSNGCLSVKFNDLSELEAALKNFENQKATILFFKKDTKRKSFQDLIERLSKNELCNFIIISSTNENYNTDRALKFFVPKDNYEFNFLAVNFRIKGIFLLDLVEIIFKYIKNRKSN